MNQAWELHNPVGVRKAAQDSGVRFQASSGERFVGFLSYRKPNATPLLQELAKRVPGLGRSVRTYAKRNSATGAGDRLLDRIAEECDAVIVASGD